MRYHNTVFHSLLKALPRRRFDALVKRFEGDRRVRRLSCWSQFVAMLYAQLCGAQSLRHLTAALGSHGNLLYHLGIKDVRRSTLSDANARRPVAVFEGVFALLLGDLRRGMAREARDVVRLIDATPVPLSALSRWAQFSARWTSAKVHMVYDPRAAVPTYFSITPARTNDIVAARTMPIEPGATYVFDKAYYDFAWWAALNERGCRFVTRLKANSPATELAARSVSGEDIVSDRVIRLKERLARSRRNPYQDRLREIVVRRDEHSTLRLVTNDLTSPAREIADLYKTRWQIELFFRWIKQNLKIRKFLGVSENAVKIQIITALIAYLLIRIVHQTWPMSVTMQTLTRLITVNLMHRKTFQELARPPTSAKTATKKQIKMAFENA